MYALDFVIIYGSYRYYIFLVISFSIVDLFLLSFGTGISKHQLIVKFIPDIFISSIRHHLLNFLMRLLIQVVVISGEIPRTPIPGPGRLVVIFGAILSALYIA
jgi:hypothetical protein